MGMNFKQGEAEKVSAVPLETLKTFAERTYGWLGFFLIFIFFQIKRAAKTCSVLTETTDCL